MEPKSTSSSSPSSHYLSNKHIIISGAGIAGLSFLLSLISTWPSDFPVPRITLYERREKSPSPEREGYTISIRSDRMSGGMQALRTLGLLNEVAGASVLKVGKEAAGGGKDKGGFALWRNDWSEVLKFKVPPQPPDGLEWYGLRISRFALRHCLIEALPGDSKTIEVRWGVGVESVEILDDGKVKVKLSDGSANDGDILIAADGANSRVRSSLRPKDGLKYAGATMISAITRLPDGVPAPVAGNYGIALGGNGNALFVSPVDQTSAVWSLSHLESEPREPLHGEAALVRKEDILADVASRGQVFSSPWPEILEATDPSTVKVFNAMDKMPIVHTPSGPSAPAPQVIYIGDASHAVSPFAGNGANMALIDGIDLAEALVSASDLETACAAFDKKCIPRSTRTVQTSHMVIAIAHATGWRAWLYGWFLLVVNWLMSF